LPLCTINALSRIELWICKISRTVKSLNHICKKKNEYEKKKKKKSISFFVLSTNEK
jgi:hypothetical protein